METGSVVYFVQAGGNGPIKIGITTRLESRIRTLQTGSPRRLRLLHTEPGGRRQELAFHRRWARHRIRGDGEWFDPAPEILDYVAGQRSFVPAIRWDLVGRAVSVPFRGLWAILVALLTLPGRRRIRKRHRVPAVLGVAAAGGSAFLWYTGQPWWVIAAVVLVACVLAGFTRSAR